MRRCEQGAMTLDLPALRRLAEAIGPDGRPGSYEFSRQPTMAERRVVSVHGMRTSQMKRCNRGPRVPSISSSRAGAVVLVFAEGL